MSELPAPLVPPEVDLRDFGFMPLDVARLRRSKAWLIAKRNPEIGFYMMNLWASSWHETPAASMEDDDDVMADAAMCAPRRWAKIKADVLHGWVKCSDGRLYHKVVAEKAIEAWDAKQKQRARSKAGNDARWGDRNNSQDEPSGRDGAGESQKGGGSDRHGDAAAVPQGLPQGLLERHKSEAEIAGENAKNINGASRKSNGASQTANHCATQNSQNPEQISNKNNTCGFLKGLQQGILEESLNDPKGQGEGEGQGERKKEPAASAAASCGAALSKNELDKIENELRQAAGLEKSPFPGLCDMSSIIGLIDQGADLQSEILPAVRAKPSQKARSWAWFVPQIQEFRANRLAAASAPMPEFPQRQQGPPGKPDMMAALAETRRIRAEREKNREQT